MSVPIIERELQFEQDVCKHSTVKYHRMTQQTGATTADCSPAGGVETIFEIPIRTLNLSRSYLSFQMTVPGGVADDPNYVHVDGLPMINTIQLYTRGNLKLVDIPEVNKYLKTVLRRECKIEDVMTWDDEFGFPSALFCSNKTQANILRPTVNGLSARGYVEPQYLMQGTVADAESVQLPIFYQIPLRNFIGTIFEVDKMINFKEVLLLRIVWDKAPMVYFTAPVNTPWTDAADGAADVPITQMYLYLAQEGNPEIDIEIKSKPVQTILVPYVHRLKQTLNGAGTHNISTRYNIGQGKRILKIYWAPFLSAGTGSEAFDNNNLGGLKVTSYYTMVDNSKTSEFDYQVGNDDANVLADSDYGHQKPLLRGSCIFSMTDYYYNWTHVENFKNNYGQVDRPFQLDENNWVDGLPIGPEIKYDICAQATGTLDHYVFAIAQRELTVSNAGIVLF